MRGEDGEESAFSRSLPSRTEPDFRKWGLQPLRAPEVYFGWLTRESLSRLLGALFIHSDGISELICRNYFFSRLV